MKKENPKVQNILRDDFQTICNSLSQLTCEIRCDDSLYLLPSGLYRRLWLCTRSAHSLAGSEPYWYSRFHTADRELTDNTLSLTLPPKAYILLYPLDIIA